MKPFDLELLAALLFVVALLVGMGKLPQLVAVPELEAVHAR